MPFPYTNTKTKYLQSTLSKVTFCSIVKAQTYAEEQTIAICKELTRTECTIRKDFCHERLTIPCKM